MKKMRIPAEDVRSGDVVQQPGTNVMHIVLANVNHPAGRMLIGGHPENTYVIGRAGGMVEVLR